MTDPAQLVGKPVKVCFEDHAENTGHLVYCEAYGRLIAADKKSITIVAWETPNDPKVEGTEWHIIRSAILRLCLLTETVET